MARAQPVREVEPINVDVIHVGERLRAVSEQSVAMMTESLSATGLLTPISVRIVELMVIDGREVAGVPVLVAGATRLAAAKRLGWSTIDTLTADIDEVEARKQEIAENLHRTELTVQERSDHISEWVRLSGSAKVAQVAPPGGRQPNDQGVREAIRKLGLERTEVQRAVKIASISERAKAAVRSAGLDNNQSVMLRVARAEPERQTNLVRQIVAEREARKPIPPSDAPRNNFEIINKDHRALVRAWEAAHPEARERFLTDIGAVIDTPVMDRGAA